MRAESIVQEHISVKVSHFARVLQGFAGVDAAAVVDGMNSLIANDADAAFYEVENLNIQLSLLCGRPIPPYPFVVDVRTDDVALARPWLDVSLNLLHAAVRLRMQGTFPLPASEFWAEAILFLDCMWGPNFASRAMACSTVANVASDVLFHNFDIGARTSDPALILRADEVMNELREIWTSIDQYGKAPVGD